MNILEENPKTLALKVISELPESSSLEDIIYTLYLQNKLSSGIYDIEKDNFKTHSQVSEDLAKWLK
jgi:hypothetical protein